MTSNLVAIYTAVAAMSITVGDDTPTVYGLASVPNKVESAPLPVRLLEIFDNRMDTLTAKHSTISGSFTPHMHVTWSISDLLLWKSEARGRGIKDVDTSLITYCQKYIDAVAANEAITATASIEDCKLLPGLFPYPASSDTFYFGVLATLTIKERVQ